MSTYDDLVELAEICLRQAQATESRAVAVVLHRMAKEYQKRAAELTTGKLPDVRRSQRDYLYGRGYHEQQSRTCPRNGQDVAVGRRYGLK